MQSLSAATAVAASLPGAIVRIKTSFSNQPLVWVVALLVALVHAATAGRYDAQRNGLYFPVCGWCR